MRKYVILTLLLFLVGSLHAQEEVHRLSILFAGDIMGHATLVDAHKLPDGSYDFDPCFEYISDYVQSTDIAIANLEVTLAGKPYSAYPCFASPDELAVAAKKAGFDILTTANNHCLDKGKKGLERTIWALDSLEIPHLGTYVDRASHDREHPLMVEKNGIRLALLCYTYGCNGFHVTQPNVVNLIDTNEMRRDMERAKEQEADYIITIIHWGIEYVTKNNDEQMRIAQWLMRNGSDIVIGGHPHVVQNLTADINPDNDRYPEIVVFSMGNLISNQRDVNTDGGIMIELHLAKQEGNTQVEECNYMPYWVDRYTQKEKKHYKIVPSTDAMEHPEAYGLNQESQKALKVFVSNLNKLLEESRKADGMEDCTWFGERIFFKNGNRIIE